MATTWIVAADESRARVLQITGQRERLAEIDHLSNPEGRAQNRELETDAEPRFHGNAGPASDREAQGAVEQSVRTFAKDLSWFNARDLERDFSSDPRS